MPLHLVVSLVIDDNMWYIEGTSKTLRLLCHPDSMQADGVENAIDELLAFLHMVNMQDIEIVERVQEGLNIKAYDGGRMCYGFEEPLHRFQNMIIDRMLGIHRVPEGDVQDMD